MNSSAVARFDAKLNLLLELAGIPDFDAEMKKRKAAKVEASERVKVEQVVTEEPAADEIAAEVEGAEL